MHIAICDENIADRKQLERLLGRESDKRKNDTGVFYVDSFGQPEVLAKNPMPYDLFFIDLLTENTNGLAFALSLCKFGVGAPIVLCSSVTDYRKEASAISDLPANLLFLDKPIKTAELSKILDSAIVIQQNRIPTIELRSDSGTYYVKEDDIMYAISHGNCVDIYLSNGSVIPIITDIYNFYDEVAMYTHMVLLTGNSMCNITYVDKYSPFKVLLKDGTKLNSSPFSLKSIKWALKQYLAESH